MSTPQRGPILAVITVLVTGALFGCSKSNSTQPGSPLAMSGTDAVVVVNGTPITQSDFYTQLEGYAPQATPMGGIDPEPAGPAVLRRMIEDLIVDSLAQSKGVVPTDFDIQQRYDAEQMLYDMNNTKSLQQQLKDQGLTPDYMKKTKIKPQLSRVNLETKDITISDADITAYYNKHKVDEFTRPESVRIQRMTFASEKDAKDISDQLQKGTPFEQLYSRSSDRSLPNGEFPQWINTEKANVPEVKDFIAVLNKTDPTKITPPIKIGNVWWVVRVEEKRPKALLTLDQVKAVAKYALLKERLEKEPNRIAEVESDIRDKTAGSQITVNDPQYKDLIQQITNPPAPPPAPKFPPPPAPSSTPPATGATPPSGSVKVNPQNGVVIKPKQ